jgi:hypothetical protein
VEVAVTKLASIRKAPELLQRCAANPFLGDRSGAPNAIFKNLAKRREVLRCLNGVKLRVHPTGDRGEFEEPPRSSSNLGEQIAPLNPLHDDSWSSFPFNAFECGRNEWESGAHRPEDHHLSVCAIMIIRPSVETEHRVGTPA